MSSYAQTTIHSRNSKIQKSKGQNTMGRIIKGIRLGISNSVGKRMKNRFNLSELENQNNQDLQISEQVELKKNTNKNQVQVSESKINDDYKADPHFYFESTVFPAIYFKKTTMRNVLKQFIFPNNCKALLPTDERSPLIYQIVANLFHEITFYVFNILVSEDSLTKSYFAFFSDSEIIPFTKCCNTFAYVQTQPNGTGKVLCNGKDCKHPSLAQFLINYEDGKKLWKNLTYLNTAPEKDVTMKQTISRFIQTGKYKNFRLKNIINEATREVEEVFNKTKLNLSEGLERNTNNGEFNDDAFVTNVEVMPVKSQKKKKLELNEDQIAQIASPDDKNIELLKIKIQYMAKRQKSLRRDLAKSIIDESKVFHKNFEMSQKIDDILRKTQFSAHNTNFSFPRLIEQLKTKEDKRNKSKSISRSFII